VVRELGDGEARSAAMAALSSVAACGGGDANENLNCEQVGQVRVSVPVVAGLAKASAARGCAVRWPTTSGATRR